MSPDEVTVVVPTFNERENLEQVAAAVTAHGYRLTIVDDNSPDGTGRIADRLAKSDPLIGVIHRVQKQGLGPAYVEAFDTLLETGGSSVIIEMDADFSHDPEDLPRLVEAVEAGADLAIGSRYVPGGATPDWPMARRMISRGGNWYAGFMLGLTVKDATAGFRAFRADALSRLPYAHAEASGYGFQVEMAWRADRMGLTIVEIPISFTDRTRGKSKMGMRIVVEAMWLVTVWGIKRMLGLNRQGSS
ncbi:MAG: polyprenol monophosphomannose synthase [Acidimicrobiia bacterium]